MFIHGCKVKTSHEHLNIKQEKIYLYYKFKPRIFATVPKIHDLKFEKLQMELEFQKKLQEEKEKWSNEQNQKISLQEVSLFIQNLNDYQKNRK